MTQFANATSRNLVLFVGVYLADQRDALVDLGKQLGREIHALVAVDELNPPTGAYLVKDPQATVIECDFDDDVDLTKKLVPYKDALLAVVGRTEPVLPLLKKLLPHVPYLQAPTSRSLEWLTNKIEMRRLLRAYDPKIAPKFLVVTEATETTFDAIEKKVGFPLIIKPAGLAASLLVSVCYHREELEANLKNTVKKIKNIYKKKHGRGEPQILVEALMEGAMYSIDSYVNDRGTVYHCPLVHVKTGRAVGFDDFFGYQRLTPVKLKPHKVEAAKRVAEKAIAALNVRSSTCHIELMKTEDGWKVIELGARIGGYRHEMYSQSYGINHGLNDILIRIPKQPSIHKKAKGYTAVMQFYAHQRGRLTSINGINKVRHLESFKRIEINKKKGDLCDFARNGDDPVFTIVLFNEQRSRLQADIRRLEKGVTIVTQKPKKVGSA